MTDFDLKQGIVKGEDSDNAHDVELIHRPVFTNPDEDLPNDFKSWDDFLVAWERYKQDTLQTFIVAKSDKLAIAHHLSKQLQYIRVSFACVRHGGYETKSTGQEKVHPYTANRLPGGDFYCS